MAILEQINERILQLLKRLRGFLIQRSYHSISDYLDDRLIVFLDVSSQEEAIKQLVEALNQAHFLRDQEEFHQAVLDREQLSSTAIGLGVSVPHAKLPGYEDFFIAIGIQSNRGIDWNSIDKSQVHLIFMIGGPDNKQTEYLNILSRLTFAMKDDERRKNLLKATSARQVIDFFQGC